MIAPPPWRAQLAALDATRPWYAPYADLLPVCGVSVAQGCDVAGALSQLRSPRAGVAGPLRFVPAASAPPAEPYEAFIARTASIPTRDNPHDFFNGLAWLRFPQTKRRLNELQAAEIARCGIGATRGPLRDALTLFDENGAVLDAPPVLWQALIARDWHRLFVLERARWSEARLLVFGHALLEKLKYPRKTATAHVLIGLSAIKSIVNDDAAMTAALDPAHLATKPFTPLPLLGVPGWWPENANFCFYDDSDVFRRQRARERVTTHRPAPSRAA